MKKVLIVTPHFPPVNAPDMQRIRMSLPFYRDGGWDPTVLTVGDRWQTGVRESQLEEALPKDVRIIRAAAVPPAPARCFGIGNIGLRSWPFLLRRGSALLRRERFDLIFFSTAQFVTFTLGPPWKRRFGVPYVLDLQDPWLTSAYDSPGARPPGGWKFRFANLQARALEGRTLAGAAGLISVSPEYLRQLAARYPGLSEKPAAVIPFGASRADLERAAAVESSDILPRMPGGRNLVYTGAAGPIAPAALEALFSALRAYRDRSPDRARRLRLHFIGTSYVAPGRGRPSVLPVAERFGVGDLVAEIPHRVGYFEALSAQRRSDGLLLLASADAAYSPSKAFTYYLAGPPILGLVFRDTVLESLLDRLKCAHLVRMERSGPAEPAFAGLHRFFDAMVDGFPAGLLPARNDPDFDRAFSIEHLTGRQCALFDEAVAGRSR